LIFILYYNIHIAIFAINIRIYQSESALPASN